MTPSSSRACATWAGFRSPGSAPPSRDLDAGRHRDRGAPPPTRISPPAPPRRTRHPFASLWPTAFPAESNHSLQPEHSSSSATAAVQPGHRHGPATYADYTGSATVIGDAMPTLQRTPVAGLSGLRYTGTATVATPGAVKDVQVVIGDLSDHDTSHLKIALHRSRRHPDHPGRPPRRARRTVQRDAPGARRGRAGGRRDIPFPTGSFPGPTATSAPSSGPPPASTWKLVVAADSSGRHRAPEPLDAADRHRRLRAARASVSPSQIAPGHSATLDASRSVSTVLHGITQYEYDYDDGSHVFTDGTAVQSHAFTRPGAHTASSASATPTGSSAPRRAPLSSARHRSPPSAPWGCRSRRPPFTA